MINFDHLANFLDFEERSDGVDDYVKGSLVELSLSPINSMNYIPKFEDNVDWSTMNIDIVCTNLTENCVIRWENIKSKLLTSTNQVI